MAQAKDTVTTATPQTDDGRTSLGSRIKRRASAAGGRAKLGTDRVRTGFWGFLEENPLMVGAATLALGVVAGLAIPTTEKENELLGETRDRLLGEVKGAGQQALDRTRRVAEVVAGTVKASTRIHEEEPDRVEG